MTYYSMRQWLKTKPLSQIQYQWPYHTSINKSNAIQCNTIPIKLPQAQRNNWHNCISPGQRCGSSDHCGKRIISKMDPNLALSYLVFTCITCSVQYMSWSNWSGTSRCTEFHSNLKCMVQQSNGTVCEHPFNYWWIWVEKLVPTAVNIF